MERPLPLLLTLVPLLLAAPALAQVGELDPSFDGDGIRADDFGEIDRPWQVALEADGGILVFGFSQADVDVVSTRVPRLTRYLPDGSLDQSWTYESSGAACGVQFLPRELTSGLVAPDGAIVTGGWHNRGCAFRDTDFEVMRIDPTTGGTTDVADYPAFQGHADVVNAVLRQPDGKIVAVGHSYGDAASTATTLDGAIARFDANLDLDTTFDSDGEVLIDVAGMRDILRDVALQDDGKLVAVGDTFNGSDADFLLVRLDADGSLDTSFDGDGIVTTDFFGFDDGARVVAIQPDGKVLVAGLRRDMSDELGFVIVRYDTDGSLDTSFSTDGMVVVDFTGLPAAARSIALQGDGKIVLAGSTETGSGGAETNDIAVARLHPSGALDPSFAGDGRQTVPVVAGQQDFSLGMVLQPFDGDVVVVGATREIVEGEDHDDAVVVRLVGDSCSLAATLQLETEDVAGEARFEACEEVAAGNGFRVLGSGDVTFRAGERIVLEDGFEVQSGGSFRAVIE